jgi:hypothetical protein
LNNEHGNYIKIITEEHEKNISRKEADHAKVLENLEKER